MKNDFNGYTYKQTCLINTRVVRYLINLGAKHASKTWRCSKIQSALHLNQIAFRKKMYPMTYFWVAHDKIRFKNTR